MRALGIVIVAIAVAPLGAAAAPGDDPGMGAVFTGAVSPDATSLLGNPAALDLGREGLHLWIGGAAALDRFTIDLDREDATGALTAGPPTSTWTKELGWQAAVYEVKSDFAAGMIVNVPPPDAMPADRDALRYHTLGGALHEKTYLGVAGSLRVLDGLYVGGSAAFTQTVIDLAFARDTALEHGRADVATTGLENPAADEIYRIHTDNSPFGFNRIAFTLGLAWQLSPRVAIGAYYREPQGFNGAVTEQGNFTLTRAPRDGGATIPQPGQPAPVATVSFIPAQTFELGGKVDVADGWSAIAGARWELTSRTQELDVRLFGSGVTGIAPEWYPRARGFRDTWSGWAGVEQVDDGQALVLGARAGVSSGAVARDRLSPMQVDGWNLSGDVGAQIRLSSVFVLVASYGARWYVPADVTSSAYDPIARLDCIDSNYDLSTPACQAVRDGYGIDTAAGHYARWDHTLRLGLRIDLE